MTDLVSFWGTEATGGMSFRGSEATEESDRDEKRGQIPQSSASGGLTPNYGVAELTARR